MYKKYTLFAILVCVTICTVLLTYYSDKKAKNQIENQESFYVLKSENDILTLYKGERFVRCYDVNTTLLPLTDQDNLRSGIILPDMAAVISAVEDFDGN